MALAFPRGSFFSRRIERDKERDDGRTDWLTEAAHFASGTRTSEATDMKDWICSGFVCCLFAVSVKSFSACVKRLIAVVVDRNWVPLFFPARRVPFEWENGTQPRL
jgi:hypothetical protein